jgi:MFS family permease
MAKIADVFGRLEAFSISIVLFVLGYIQMACAQNVETYASAQIFYSSGSTGLQILQQIFIADTSNLLNRALFSSLPDTPFLVTVWVGPIIASMILASSTWRWGYAIWSFILPAAFLPLALSLFLNGRKAKKLGLVVPKKTTERQTIFQAAKKLFFDLDVVGMLLLGGAFSLILIPLTLASKVEGGWTNGRLIAMIVLGVVCLVLFPIWESQPKLARHPLIPMHLLRSRTFCAGCAAGFFYFSTLFPVTSLWLCPLQMY